MQFSSTAIEVETWMSNYISYKIMGVFYIKYLTCGCVIGIFIHISALSLK